MAIFKKKGPSGSPLEQVEQCLGEMGYTLEGYGRATVEGQLQTGLTPAEVASQIVYTTMAYDLRHAGTTATASLRYRPLATGVLTVLDRYRDAGLMSEARHKHDYDLMVAINAINEKQLACIDAVLADPVLGGGRLASNTGKRR